MIKTTVVGNYPKLPSEKGQINIRKTLHRFDKNEISQSDLEAAFDEVTARVVSEQIEAGIDLPTDGQIRWDDIVTPLAAKMGGFQIGGLLRWFDNNVYYRRPKIVGAIEWSQAITTKNFILAQQNAKRPLKAVLPAPYSFAMLCDDAYYHDLGKLLAATTVAIRSEAKALVAAGARYIQFDDPCLPYDPINTAQAIAALNQAIEGLNCESWTAYYFSNLAKLESHLPKLKVNVIAADCVSHPRNFEILTGLKGKFNCSFGLVDARNIKMEKESSVLGQLEKIASQFSEAYVSPSCGLEFLPHRDAVSKLKFLAGAVETFNRGRVNA